MSLQGIDLQVHTSGTNLAGLEFGAGLKLPETGTFSVQNRLMGSIKDISPQEIQGQVSRGGMMLSLQGEVKDLQALRGMNRRPKLNYTGFRAFSLKDLHQFVPLFGPDEVFQLFGKIPNSTSRITPWEPLLVIPATGVRLYRFVSQVF